MSFSAIVCVDSNNGIGYKGEPLYKIPKDMERFKKLTTGHTVIMGWKTWESLGEEPLPDRTNIILTHKPIVPSNTQYNYIKNATTIFAKDSDDFFETYKNSDEEVFIIGGASIYEQFLPYCNKIYLTRVYKTFGDFVDTFFPIIDETQWQCINEFYIQHFQGVFYKHLIYERKIINKKGIVALIGESASGKSSIEKELTKRGYDKIITYTTRPMRIGDINGKTYHFISNENFERFEKIGFFAETAEYNNWKYGSAKKDYIGKRVVVLTPRGFRNLKKNENIDITSFYINVPRRDRLIKILQRGDNIEEAYRRNMSDVGQFDGVKDEVDYVIENPNYTSNPSALAELIQRKMEQRKMEK